MARTEGDGECGVQFSCVESVVYPSELYLGFWLRGCPLWDGQADSREVDVQQRVQTGDRADCGGCKGCPGAYLADIPPEVFGTSIADMNVELADESRCWVR